MRTRSSLGLILPLIFISALTVSSPAAVQNRIAAVNSAARVALPHTVPARALVGTDLGEAPSNHQFGSLMLTFSMTDAQQAALTQLLIDLQNPSSPRYHQWLTPEQFGQQFGLSSSDITQVSSWLSSQGFTVTGVGRASNYVTFSGTAGQVQQAFGTVIHTLNVNGETHVSNLTDPALPAGIAAVVTNLSGLNDFKLKARVRPHTVKPDFTSSLTGTHYIAPGDFYTIYNVSPLIAASITGQGVTIAVMGQTDISTADVTAFRTASGLCTTVSSTCPNPLPTVKVYGPDPGLSTSDIDEASLDVEWAGAVAPNANILYVNSTDVIDTSLVMAIDNNLAPIISISYGDCEPDFGASSVTKFNQFFEQANAQGQTIVGPGGDSGATDCDFVNYPAVGGLAVDYPAASPFVTAAGGSMFNEGAATGATTYWNTNSASSTSNAGSALSYIPEAVWNETSATNGLAAGGGGTSIYSSKPYWQVGTGVPADFSRDVPDISLNAASNHDGTLYCVQGSCTAGTFRNAASNLSVVGGTSVAAPSFAGILALIEQKTGSTTGLGNIGPELYALAGNPTIYANAFHDITTGNNDSACTTGTPNCTAGGSIGYNAGVGYDLATGWGSINAAQLASSWNTVPPINPGTTIGQNISATTLTTSSPLCGATGSTQALNLTVRVASSVGGNTPTGTITIVVDNAATTTTATLSGGTATINFSTAGQPSGFHTISAIYSGDSVNASSKNSITADIVSSTAPDFSFTPCTATTSTLPGGTAPGVTLTVTPVNGFSGTVTFSASSLDAVDATFAFTPTTVTTNGTTSFVLYGYASDAITTQGLTRLKATAKQDPPRAPWYVPASGATIACALLLVLPRRRRWSALLAVVLSVAALGAAIGCGGSSTSNSGGGGGGGGGGTTTPAAPGTYSILVTATATTTAGPVAHSTTVTFTVQ
jgi:subtilase family serine protease